MRNRLMGLACVLACGVLAACSSGKAPSQGGSASGSASATSTSAVSAASTPSSSTPANSAAPLSGHLTIYTARNKDVTDFVIGEFTKAHPEMQGKIEVINMGAGDIPNRVEAEKSNPQGDVWWGGTQQSFELAASEGLLTAWNPSFAAQIDAQNKDPQGRWFGEILFPEVIMTNDKAVTAANAPKDWNDLLSPAWKGKIVIRDVLASGSMKTAYSAMIYQSYKTSNDPKQGYDWLCKLDKNTTAYAANPADLYLRLSRQEGTISIWDLPDILVEKYQHNEPFGFVMPASGAPVVTDGVAVINGSHNQTAAEAFVNFLFNPDIRAQLAAKFYEIPTVPMNNPPSWINDVHLKQMNLDWSVIGKNQQTWMTYWNTHIKNQC